MNVLMRLCHTVFEVQEKEGTSPICVFNPFSLADNVPILRNGGGAQKMSPEQAQDPEPSKKFCRCGSGQFLPWQKVCCTNRHQGNTPT